jgi:hypothetical integral membrane protein (TIGR02206 family)
VSDQWVAWAADDRFHAGSGQHYLLIAATVVGAVAMAWWGRHDRGTRRELVVRRTFGATLLAIGVVNQVYWIAVAHRGLQTGLPLQLSDLALYAAAYALWTRGPRTAAFAYYVGLSLTSMAILTPALTDPFPTVGWFAFWCRHVPVVWAAVYLVWGLGIRPTWRLYRSTVVVVLAWAVVAYVVDVAADANYGYLRSKPSTGSALEPLGPWPWYVVAAMVILLTAWALVLTLPWELLADRWPS